MRLVFASFVLGACSSTGGANDPSVPPLDIAAACASVRPPPDCPLGCNGTAAQEAAWSEGYLDHVAAEWGAPRAEVDGFLQVREVSLYGVPSQYATLSVALTDGWVDAVFEVRGSLDHPATDAADAESGLSSGAPVFDRTHPPRPWDEVATFVADCEDRLGVTFPDPWCAAYLTMDPNDDDQTGVRFDFQTEVGANYTYALASVYAWGDEADQCRTNQAID